MQEIFYEECADIQNKGSAKTKYVIFNILSILSFVLLGVWVLFLIVGYKFSSIIIDLIFILLPSISFLVCGIVLGKIKNKFYVDYDYTFITGSVRFSKVIMNTSWQPIIEFETKDIEKLGYYNSTSYNKYLNYPDIIKETLTSNVEPSYDKDFYYLVVNKDSNKFLFILECTKTFIINILKFSNKTILDEDFVKSVNAQNNK